jgi:hypothetical protein
MRRSSALLKLFIFFHFRKGPRENYGGRQMWRCCRISVQSLVSYLSRHAEIICRVGVCRAMNGAQVEVYGLERFDWTFILVFCFLRSLEWLSEHPVLWSVWPSQVLSLFRERIVTCGCSLPFVGAFVKLGKATISFVMSVLPSARMEQLGWH